MFKLKNDILIRKISEMFSTFFIFLTKPVKEKKSFLSKSVSKLKYCFLVGLFLVFSTNIVKKQTQIRKEGFIF